MNTLKTDRDGAAVTIRYATGSDALLLAEIGAETFYDAYAGQLAAAALEQFVATLFSPELQAAELADPATFFLILEVDGWTAGYASLREEPRPGAETGRRGLKISRIYLRQPWIGRGVGSRLMQACLDAAAARGYDSIWLDVWEQNDRALAFYQKWGFEQVGSVRFPFGSELQTDLVLERPLTEKASIDL